MEAKVTLSWLGFNRFIIFLLSFLASPVRKSKEIDHMIRVSFFAIKVADCNTLQYRSIEIYG